MQSFFSIVALILAGFGLSTDLFASTVYETLWQAFPPVTESHLNIARLVEALVLGMLLLTQIFHLSLSVQHRQKHGEAWLVLFAFAAMLRIIAGTEFLQNIASWSLRLDFAAMGICSFALGMFTLQSLKLPRARLWLSLLLILPYSLLSLFSELPQWMPWRYLGCTQSFALLLFILAGSAHAVRLRRPGAMLSFAGLLAFLIADAHDAAEILAFLPAESPAWRPYGFALLVLTHIQIIAKILLQSQDKILMGLARSEDHKPEAFGAERERVILMEIQGSSHEKFCFYMSGLSRMLDDADRLVDAALERDTEVMRRLFLLLHTAKATAQEFGLHTIGQQIDDLEQISLGLLKTTKSYWNPVHLHTEIEGIRRLLRLYLRLNTEKLGRSIESIADLLVETKYLNAHSPVLSRAEEHLPELVAARNRAEALFARVVQRSLQDVMEDILSQVPRSQPISYALNCPVDRLVPFETQRLLRVIMEVMIQNACQHAFRNLRPSKNIMKIELADEAGGIFLKIEDNGGGIALAPLKLAGQKSGLTYPNMSNQDFAELLLNGNFQSEKRGLLRLQRLLESYGGQVSIRLHTDAGVASTFSFSLHFHLPASCFLRNEQISA